MFWMLGGAASEAARCDMKTISTPGRPRPRLDARDRFRAAWVAAFLGVVLTIGALFWAIMALA
jgi:hypothetical protein